MPGAIQYRNHEGHVAPYPVSTGDLTGGVAIVGAQIVEVSPDGVSVRIARPGASPARYVGVALQDAGQFGVPGVQAALNAPANEPSGPTYPGIMGGTGGVNDNVLSDMSGILGNVSVANFAEIFVYFTNAAAFGDFLTVSQGSGSNSALLNIGGCVTTYTGTDPKVIVGKCTNPGGVLGATAANPVLGRALIATV